MFVVGERGGDGADIKSNNPHLTGGELDNGELKANCILFLGELGLISRGRFLLGTKLLG